MVFDSSSRRVRVSASCIVVTVALALGIARTTLADPTDGPFPHLRTTHPMIRALIAEATERSPTFRRLAEIIEGSDGIVYVEEGACGHGVRACLTLSITTAARYRVLRVVIDTRAKAVDLMASIGHELQHAVEVLGNPTVVNTETLYLFYAKGSSNLSTLETQEAIRAGYAVGREVASYGKH